MNTWIALDVGIVKHRKMSALPSDSARYGWIVVLLEAKKQKPAGTFGSRGHFRDVMGRFGRFLPAYIKVGLLDETDDELSVHDWQQYQWAVQKQRQREDKERTKNGPTETSTETVTFKSLKRPLTRVDSGPQRLADLLPRNYVAELRKAQAE